MELYSAQYLGIVEFRINLELFDSPPNIEESASVKKIPSTVSYCRCTFFGSFGPAYR